MKKQAMIQAKETGCDAAERVVDAAVLHFLRNGGKIEKIPPDVGKTQWTAIPHDYLKLIDDLTMEIY